MLKHWRVMLLLVTVLGATLAVGMKVYPYGRHGVEIVYVSEDSPAFSILEQGMIITSFNGQEIENLQDWNEKTANLSGEVNMIANAQDYELTVNDTLGIQVTEMERTNLDLGLDLRGGTRIILKPEKNATKEMINQVIGTLQTRANIYGLQEMKFYPINTGTEWMVQIEAAGVGSDIVNNLLSSQGTFEAKIIKPVELSSGEGNLILGTETYPVEVINDTLTVNSEQVTRNQTFTVKGIEFEYMNSTSDQAVLLAQAYTGDDVELVYTDPKHSRMVPQKNAWTFMFSVLISDEGAKRFADITAGIPKQLDIQTGDEYLESKILLYLDDQMVSDLRISGGLGGKIINTPSITGTRKEREDALDEKLRLQTILRSGALPTTLETVSVDTVSPRLGAGFFVSAGWGALLAGIVVVCIILIRYRSFKVAIPLGFVGLSEIIIILGIAAKGDSLIWAAVLLINLLIVGLSFWKGQKVDIYAWGGALLIPLLGMMSWTIDLPAIGGIIAAIGTGVDHQIIIADETLRGKKLSLKIPMSIKDKIKRAFFIIFGAAATTIAAMVPLMFLGVGLVRGFAITTIVGVLVGILVTRPAYARIVESLTKQ